MPFRRSKTLLFCLFIVTFSSVATTFADSKDQVTSLQITNGKSSDYEIVVSANATQVAREGAIELQRLLRIVSGADLSIVKVATSHRHQIVIGEHPLATAAGVTASGLAADGFRIRAIAGNLYLIGKDLDRGELFKLSNSESSHAGSYFAVIEFAQRFLGVNWYMPGPMGEEAPHRDQIVVPANLDMTIQPRFSARSINITFGSVRPHDLEHKHNYLKKHQQSGRLSDDYFDATTVKQAVRWGRRIRLGNSFQVNTWHAWYRWVPAEKPNSRVSQAYGKTHPEYYALRNGKRANHYRGKSHAGQLCVSNPDVVRTYAQNVIAYSKRSGVKNFSLSCNDGAEHCECKNCRAWDVHEDANGQPILTDRLARFANAVAQQVTAVIPDVTFGLYAYHDTRIPSRQIKLHPSIIVSDVYNYMPSLFHSDEPRQMMIKDLRGWREQTKRIVVTSYYYGEGFWGMPWSTLDVQDWLMKLLAEYPSSAGFRMCYTAPGDMTPMGMLGADPWVLSKLMWDPSQSVIDLKHEFYNGAFGKKAGPLIEKYFEVINQANIREIAKRPLKKQHASANVFNAAMLSSAYGSIGKECRSLIQQAVAAVANAPERYQWRVDRIARNWRVAELTRDGINAANIARRTTGSARKAAWDKAIRLGKQRMALAASPESRHATAIYSLDYMDKYAPIGVIRKMPGNENLILPVPTINTHKIVIDGQLNEAIWKQATMTSSFKENKNSGIPIASTRVRVLANTSGLLVGFTCREPQMKNMRVVDDPKNIWRGDVVEIYLAPNGNFDSYMQFMVNPNGVGKSVIKRGDQGTDLNWNPKWQYAAHKTDKSWRVEIRIPWATLGYQKVPDAGTQWRGDFFRERATSQSELSAWSPTGAGFANPMKFGRLQF